MKRLKILLCLALASLAYGADLNTASKSELMSLGLSKSQALNVIKYRKALIIHKNNKKSLSNIFPPSKLVNRYYFRIFSIVLLSLIIKFSNSLGERYLIP